ncbi:MAG: hypothetical protein IKG72_13100 [Bacillus sp. (in: Bacteria)]|nr:hypothetical protein [Bacillus sp. (in: firmicutes)]
MSHINPFKKIIREHEENAKMAEINAVADAKEDKIQKILEGVEVGTVEKIMEDLAKHEYHLTLNEEDNPMGISGNTVSKMVNIEGKNFYVCGKDTDELKEDLTHILLGLHTGVKFQCIAGMFYVSGRYLYRDLPYGLLCFGKTEKELDEDEILGRKMMKKVFGTETETGIGMSGIITAEDLRDAGLKAVQFKHKGETYVFVPEMKAAFQLAPLREVADIKDIKTEVNDEIAIELLKGRIVEHVEDNYDEDDEDYDEEEYDD